MSPLSSFWNSHPQADRTSIYRTTGAGPSSPMISLLPTLDQGFLPGGSERL